MDTEAHIFNTFTAWFDADLLDIDDPQAVQDATGAWANDLIHRVPDVGAVIAALSGMLDAYRHRQVHGRHLYRLALRRADRAETQARHRVHCRRLEGLPDLQRSV